MTTNHDSSRVEREREFHNKEFAENDRIKVSSVYHTTRASTNLFIEVLGENVRGKRVLEFGCGQNSYAIWMAERGAEVVGIDISDEAIEQMRDRARSQRISDKVSFLRMNAEQLDFPDGSFDVVAGRAILHHLDLEKSLSEISRTLRPGGIALFVEPLGHNPMINAYRNRTPELRTPDEHPLLMSDLKLAERHFGKVTVHYFHLASLAAAPFAKTRLFSTVLSVLEQVDSAIFKWLPFLRKHAWAVVLVFTKAPA